MVHSRTRHNLILKLVFLPGKWSFEYIQQPYVILCLIARIAAEYNEIGLIEEHGVAVALSGCGVFITNFDYFPDWSTSLHGYSLRRSRMYSSSFSKPWLPDAAPP